MDARATHTTHTLLQPHHIYTWGTCACVCAHGNTGLASGPVPGLSMLMCMVLHVPRASGHDDKCSYCAWDLGRTTLPPFLLLGVFFSSQAVSKGLGRKARSAHTHSSPSSPVAAHVFNTLDCAYHKTGLA